jgi:hypothetical protein
MKIRGAEPILLRRPMLTYSSALLECYVPMTTPLRPRWVVASVLSHLYG